MAIINSVLIGKGKGKVGNVVLSNLKGQTLMRSVPQKAKKPPTPEQINRRNMLSNSVTVYRIFKSYLRFTNKARNGKSSIYNTFVSRIIEIFDTLPILSAPQMYDQIEQFSFYLNTSFDISINIENNDKLVIEFPKFVGFINSKFRIVCYYTKDYYTPVTVVIRQLTFNELWAGHVEIAVPNAYAIKSKGAYIYSQDKKVLSSVTFY